MTSHISNLYEGGTQPCLLASLQTGTAQGIFHGAVKQLLQRWISAIAEVLTEAGLEPDLAQQRGQDAIIAVQGALMLSQALDSPVPFQRVLKALPQDLLAAWVEA